MANGKFIAYYRVSTQKQGQSGLGLEAQEQAVLTYLNGGEWDLVQKFVEVETGKGSDALDRRPQLKAALEMCKKQKATLLIAVLDRLGRNVHFISGLMESGIDFVSVESPNDSPFMLHVKAAVAEEEGRKISARTKAALQAAKARGAGCRRRCKPETEH
jgi:DNA invertase Pin-like site-specific DNA recombinase